jgi:ubiquinone/menaquinone biosynthesis C-methylase UbiE
MSENTSAVKQYKNISRSYDSRFREYITVTTNKIAALTNIAPGTSVLDLGCGTGDMLLKLAQEYSNAGLLTGMDTSEEMLTLAKAKLASFTNVHLQLGSIEKIPYPDKHFDLIVSSGVIHYIQDIDSMTKEAFRVLKPHGRILLIDMAKESLTTKISSVFRSVADPGTVRYYSLHSASKLMRSQGFEIQSVGLFRAGVFGLFLIESVRP